jgi:cobalamin biosynthesis protein CobT
MAIGEALNAIHVPFEMFGATTTSPYGVARNGVGMDGFSRTNPIYYKHYKLFNEPWAQVRERIVHTGAHNHNVDGEVVEYAAFRLQSRKESRTVVFSLSDGEPCAGHGNDELMAKNLKRVCEKARKAVIEVYGAGLGTRGPEFLYGPKWFLYLDTTEEMGPEFIRKFAKVITDGRVRM